MNGQQEPIKYSVVIPVYNSEEIVGETIERTVTFFEERGFDYEIILGEDEHGHYIGLTGQYQYTVAFSHSYIAEPLVKLYAGSSVFHVSMTVTNLKQSEQTLESF